MGGPPGAQVGVSGTAQAFKAPEDDADAALGRLLAGLEGAGYAFISPTPATHALAASRRPFARPGDLRDVFGWGRAFAAGDIDRNLFAHLEAGGGLVREGDRFRFRHRVSTLEGRLHLHSARASDPDAVFLGPDSYRFTRFLRHALDSGPTWRRAVDIGAGAGAGALALAARPGAGAVFATDINPSALRCLSINARHAGLDVTARLGPGLMAVQGHFDLIIANPPYIADRAGRTYRDGGGMYGARLALDWMMESVPRLARGGRILLYTGAPIVDGRDVVRSALEELATEADLELGYEEIDPDVFGGVLRDPAYAEVERIAAVGAVLSR